MRRRLLIALFAAAICGLFFVANLATARADIQDAGETSVVLPARGVDTSLRPSLAQYKAIHAAGYSFIGRYLAIPGGGKRYPLTWGELRDADTAHVKVFAIFEWGIGSHLPVGFAAGVRDAKLARQALKQLDRPLSTVVYFSLDRTPNSRYLSTEAAEYFRGIKSVTHTAATIGCYGSKAQLLALKSRGLIKYLFHARWMDHVSPYGWGAHLWQSTVKTWPGGVPCDRDWALVPAFGAVR